MKSIFSTFKVLHKDGKPLDFLATWKKTFDKASERETTLFQKMYCDSWFTTNTPQMSLTAEALDRKSTRLNSSHSRRSRMPSSA